MNKFFILISLIVLAHFAAKAQCPGPSQRTNLINLQKSQSVEGTLAGQLPLTDDCGNLRYSQYVEIENTPVGFIPTSTGNTSNFSEFVIASDSTRWYIDWQGRGYLIGSGATTDKNGYYGGNGGNGGDATIPSVTKSTLTNQLTFYRATDDAGGLVPIRIEVAAGNEPEFLSFKNLTDSLLVARSDQEFTITSTNGLNVVADDVLGIIGDSIQIEGVIDAVESDKTFLMRDATTHRLKKQVGINETDLNFSVINIFNSNGSLTSNRTLDGNGKNFLISNAALLDFSTTGTADILADGELTLSSSADNVTITAGGTASISADSVFVGTVPNNFPGEKTFLTHSPGGFVTKQEGIDEEDLNFTVANIYNSDGFFPPDEVRIARLDTSSRLDFRYSNDVIGFQIVGNQDSVSSNGEVYIASADNVNRMNIRNSGVLVVYNNEDDFTVRSDDGNSNLTLDKSSSQIEIIQDGSFGTVRMYLDTVGKVAQLMSNNETEGNSLGFDRSQGDGVYVYLNNLPDPGQILVAGSDNTFHFANPDTVAGINIFNSNGTIPQITERTVSLDSAAAFIVKYPGGINAIRIYGGTNTFNDGSIFLRSPDNLNYYSIDNTSGHNVRFANGEDFRVRNQAATQRLDIGGGETVIRNNITGGGKVEMLLDTSFALSLLISERDGVYNSVGFSRNAGLGLEVVLNSGIPNPGDVLAAGADGTFYYTDPDTLGGIKEYVVELNTLDSATSSGLLVIGQDYVIQSGNLAPGDDFTNVGYTAEDVIFTATGTTPTDWTNGTVVTNVAASQPQATVLQNGIGSIVWTTQYGVINPIDGQPYTGIFGTLAGAFPDQTRVNVECINDPQGTIISMGYWDNDNVLIYTIRTGNNTNDTPIWGDTWNVSRFKITIFP